MVKKVTFIISFVFSLMVTPCQAQTWGSNPELDKLESYYVKSLNEFMHRFNAEEIPPFFRDDMKDGLRQRCILALFDLEQVSDLESERATLIQRFDSVVCATNSMLHINDTGMYVEALCLFKYKKRSVILNLVLKYENIRDDFYRWAIVGVNGMVKAGLIDTSLYGYINPVQHELHFLALTDAFPHINGYFSKDKKIDPLSYFAGLAESGVLHFEGCQSVTYFFTQVPGYVFSVLLHPRKGINSGWLIHDLIEIPDESKDMFINELFSL